MVRNKLKEILDSKGIKQTWLAEQTGVTKQTMSSLVSNRYSTSIDVAFKISKILDMDIKEIFYEDND